MHLDVSDCYRYFYNADGLEGFLKAMFLAPFILKGFARGLNNGALMVLQFEPNLLIGGPTL